MAKINILPAKVYNRIAAGEVVDRPYSVVKELIENSIDAGATEISVYIEHGGKQLIRVVDNGCGIAKDDLYSAYLPHATSKIETAEDLESIMTLGFRGEAVASIAAVSKMMIVSKVAGEKCYSLQCDGGEIGGVTEASGEDGTDVSVNMLFYNAPVRLKFLKTDKGEESDITALVSRFILNRPNISFTYYADGKTVLQSFGGGEQEAIVGVYGASILQNCYQIAAEKHGINIRGYIGNQNFSKPNKSYQTVFLNGRWIVNATISAAISKAYMSYLMKRQYPFYVLYIDVPTEIVDVNVHPNKADVRFSDNQMIFGCIHSVIAGVLDGQSVAMEYLVGDYASPAVSGMDAPVQATGDTKSAHPSGKAKALPFDDVEEEEPAAPRKMAYRSTLLDGNRADSPVFMGFDKMKPGLSSEEEKVVSNIENIGAISHVTTQDGRMRPLGDGEANAETPTYGQPEDFQHMAITEERLENDLLRAEKKKPSQEEEPVPQRRDIMHFLGAVAGPKEFERERINARYVGKLYNTYLLYEYEEDVYIIDQHAAHERLIFDKLRKQMRERTVVKQPMLVPYVLKLNVYEAEFIQSQLENLRLMGFEIEPVGMSDFQVNAVPADLQRMKLTTFFFELLGNINKIRAIELEELVHDRLATAACKAAIKGGMDITEDEIYMLFKMLKGDMGLKCPHGRPVAVKLTKANLEKMFKRKV